MDNIEGTSQTFLYHFDTEQGLHLTLDSIFLPGLHMLEHQMKQELWSLHGRH